MGPKRPLLRLQAHLPAGVLDLDGQLARGLDAGRDPEPEHALQAAAAECAHPVQAELERRRVDRLQQGPQRPEPDFVHVAEEPQREVEVGGRHPAELGIGCRAPLEIRGQAGAVRLGQRDADERPDQNRRGFQCSGIQVRGEVALKLK